MALANNTRGKQKDAKGTSKGMTEYILSHPISCGYLLVFSEAEHNAENLNFIMEVDRFKDQYSDPSCWSRDWITIDNELRLQNGKDNQTPSEARWTSRVVNREAMLADIKEVWEAYLSDDSPNQICLSTEILRRTKNRIDNLHLYGTEVFGEALLDPIKTINRDILPRFMKSETYRVLNSHLASADPLPLASTLNVPPPNSTYIEDESFMDLIDTHVFTLDDLMNDKYLYDEFLGYLRRQYSSENLLCVRMINLFEDLIANRDLTNANIQAWEIYKYFVAPGSAFEVSCSFRVRKEVMLSLSKSSSGDFDKVKRSAVLMLNANFESFQATPEYAGLRTLLKVKKQGESKSASMFGDLNIIGSLVGAFKR